MNTRPDKGVQQGNTPRQVVSISLGDGSGDFEFESSFMGQDLSIRRMGVGDDLARARQVLQEWDDKADVFAVGNLENSYVLGRAGELERQHQQVLDACKGLQTPVVTGNGLRRMGQEWSIRHLQFKFGDSYFNNTKALFLSGRISFHLAKALAEYTDNLLFADPLLEHASPLFLHSLSSLQTYSHSLRGLPHRLPGQWMSSVFPPLKSVSAKRIRKAIRDSFTVVVPEHNFFHYLQGTTGDDLKEKIVITSAATDDRIQFLSERGVDTIIDTTPMILDRVVDSNTLEAAMVAAVGSEMGALSHDDILEIISSQQMVPRVVYPSGKPKRKNRFAFVIHPLAQEHLKKDKVIGALAKHLPNSFMNVIEKLIAYAPPWIHCKFTGVKSPTGVEAEGWLIIVGGTPKQMLSHNPEFTYKQLLKAADIAKKKGAQIMGLGAFTKVVGDAGVTVAKLADIPITTGNSYSASGALWAATDAARRMGLLEIVHGKRLKAKVMVVGATGAIGSVCCRLLAYAFEEIHMVDIRDARLLALRESIHQDCPEVTLHVSTRADKYLADMDVIVTATSGAGKSVLDIMQVKPGCIITDVARPLDLPPEDVAKRPDVLVIESGEIKVPGEPRFLDIGLPPGGIVYACLAETIVLALEGRYETFTVGRNIEWEKVREIYRLGLKHGMELAAISGVNGLYTDEDIANVRKMALLAREKHASATTGSAEQQVEGPTPATVN